MVALAVLICLGLLTLLFDNILERQSNPNREPRSSQSVDGAIEVELTANRAGHFVASGSIDGVPARFLLDTGATNIAVPASLARRAGLEFGPEITVGTANGMATGYLARLGEVRLGGIVLRDLNATIMADLPDDEVLLGMNFLGQIEFTQRGARLTLRQ